MSTYTLINSPSGPHIVAKTGPRFAETPCGATVLLAMGTRTVDVLPDDTCPACVAGRVVTLPSRSRR